MILADNFYTVVPAIGENAGIRALLTFNPDHPIFGGHFPGQPVVPGVCMLQIIKELLEKKLGKRIRLQNAYDLKFLSVIDPQRHSSISAEIDHVIQAGGPINVTARLFNDETTFFKFKGVFVESLEHE